MRLFSDTSQWAPQRVGNMKCFDCGSENKVPKGRTIRVDEIFDGHVDVDVSIQEHTQLECRDCGAVLGYLAAGAAVGSNDIRGYY